VIVSDPTSAVPAPSTTENQNESSAPTTESGVTEATEGATEVETGGTESPTQGTEGPTEGTEGPTEGTEGPTEGTEGPTQGTTDDGEDNGSTTNQACEVRCGAEDEYLANPRDCGSYYQCSNGEAVLRPCSPDLVFDPELEVCVFPEDYECVVTC